MLPSELVALLTVSVSFGMNMPVSFTQTAHSGFCQDVQTARG